METTENNELNPTYSVIWIATESLKYELEDKFLFAASSKENLIEDLKNIESSQLSFHRIKENWDWIKLEKENRLELFDYTLNIFPFMLKN